LFFKKIQGVKNIQDKKDDGDDDQNFNALDMIERQIFQKRYFNHSEYVHDFAPF